MVKKFLLMLVLFIFLVQPASALIDTEIKIKTIPDYEVQATTYDASSVSFNVFKSFKAISDEYGDVSFTFTSNELKFNLIIYIKKDGVTLMGPEKFLNNLAEEDIDLRLAPDSFVFIETPVEEVNVSDTNLTGTNSTDNETLGNETAPLEGETTTEEDSEADTSGSTGFSVSGDDGSFPGKFLYYIIGVLALLAVIFGTFKVTQMKLLRSGAIHKGAKGKLDDLQREKKEKRTEYRKVIDDAEKKIKEARSELKKIGNEDKIKEMKKKIEDDEKELIKLREGKD